MGRSFVFTLSACFLACVQVGAQDATLAQNKSAAVVAAQPALQFQVLKTRRIQVGDHSLYLNRVAPPVLPAAPSSPLPPSAEETVKASEPRQKSEVLFLATTVYDRKVTALRWWGETGERRVFSNIDFNLLCGAGSIETPETIYTLMLAVGNEPAEEGGGSAKKTAVKDWAARFGKAIPAPETFSKTRSEYFVAEDETHAAPSEEELSALDALHVYFDANQPRLADEYVKREATQAEQARLLKEHPPVPRDIIVNYWRKPNEAPKPREAQ